MTRWGARGGSKPSMLVDLEQGRRLELPFLSGYLVDRGKALGIATPEHSRIVELLAPFVNGGRTK